LNQKCLSRDNEIIESFLDGTSVCSVINYREKTTVPLRKSFPDNEFFDYEAKYTASRKKLPPSVLKRWLKGGNIAKRAMNY
jgi:D-alanine-D-alanine ligase-like ATP-grasp enzyme